MKRINDIARILLDPERRCAYDEGLHLLTPLVRQVGVRQGVVRQSTVRPSLVRQLPPIRGGRAAWKEVGWAAVAFLGLTLAALWVAVPSNESKSEAVAATNPPLNPEPPAATPGRSAKLPLRLAPLRRPSPSPEVLAADSVQPSLMPFTTGAASEESPAPAPVRADPAIPLPPPPTKSPPSLFGRWVFAPAPGETSESGKYQAIYIELSISSVGDTLHGAFQGRYRVPDRALNPVVNFRFDGPSAGSSFVWEGDAGSRGNLKLRLKHSNALEVEWVATAMGARLSLVSGSAILYRFQ
jgi:hypothetical protein